MHDKPRDETRNINKRYEAIGDDDSFVIADTKTGKVAGAAFADLSKPGWWECLFRGNNRRIYVEATHPEPWREVAWRLTR
ncbi:hypothetical protein [Actinomadura litoris]|uniref:hypothetical protein n=1 Tax=Actinomadura litoris TaxID=2678616 RepID=UPI001FA7E743|nr:hypothetical protein [Actinomadura litoris]